MLANTFKTMKKNKSVTLSNTQSNNVTSKKPQMEDFYDSSDPRGMGRSEHEDFCNAVKDWNSNH